MGSVSLQFTSPTWNGARKLEWNWGRRFSRFATEQPASEPLGGEFDTTRQTIFFEKTGVIVIFVKFGIA